MAVWMVSAILIVTLYLLITEKVPVDLTAIGIMVMLMISRVLAPIEAVAGFAHPAVITVGSMFLVSKGMVRTDAVGYIDQDPATVFAKQYPNLEVLERLPWVRQWKKPEPVNYMPTLIWGYFPVFHRSLFSADLFCWPA